MGVTARVLAEADKVSIWFLQLVLRVKFLLPHAAKCIKRNASTFLLKLEAIFRISVHLMIPKNSQSSISFFHLQACI